MKKILYILAIISFVLCIDKINAYTEYKIGDVISYNGMDFYVIKDSGSKEDSITMLKAEPLTVDEVNEYGGVGTDNNHVNNYIPISESCYQKASNVNGYGGMQYYSSLNCGYNGTNWVYEGCRNDYVSSDIKYVIDAWKNARVPYAIEARLFTITEVSNLGYEWKQACGSCGMDWVMTSDVPKYVYNSNYWYWIMDVSDDSSSLLRNVLNDGELAYYHLGNDYIYYFYGNGVVRPVITVKKTALGDEDESIVDDKDSETADNKTDEKDNADNKTNETKTTVKVTNTYMSSSIIIIILGFMIASVSVLIIYKLSNKKK